jgi:ubiquinone/menaquinone biosynthesis C-methylase UbiE
VTDPQLLLEFLPAGKGLLLGTDNLPLFYAQLSQRMSLPEKSLEAGVQRKNVDVFDRDAEINKGYHYTKSVRLSCRLATQRSMDAILATASLSNRSVVDVGCGDGFYTIRFWDRAQPRLMVGLDPAGHAISVANTNKENRPVQFLVGDAHQLPFPNNSFDVALVQSILHHDDNPRDVIREAFRVAPKIVIHEPNGNNLGLKVIEKLSRYHREHNEKSYTSSRLRQWIEESGGVIACQRFAGFVPMFCPSVIARTMKALEPLVEAVPLVNKLGCAVIVIVAQRRA